VLGLLGNISIIMLLRNWEDTVNDLEVYASGAWWSSQRALICPSASKIDGFCELAVGNIDIFCEFNISLSILSCARRAKIDSVEKFVNDKSLFGSHGWIVIISIENDTDSRSKWRLATVGGGGVVG